MESIGVLLLRPISPYLQDQLNKRFTVHNYWIYQNQPELLSSISASIRAIVRNARNPVDADLIDSLPKLEIVSNHGVGFDRIDLEKCKQMGIRVTNTPHVLSDEVADTTIALILAALRRIVAANRFVRDGQWVKRDFPLTTKV
uniref:D-isomer specific 2-hydroxyacid dehydrogenase catalytic domain-containing protein n=1 Tax=Kalanchoe fedtschenkoi TaxID=63787 RepID=A0A7N0VJ97_KALFE